MKAVIVLWQFESANDPIKVYRWDGTLQGPFCVLVLARTLSESAYYLHPEDSVKDVL